MILCINERYNIRNEANCSFLIRINKFSSGSDQTPVFLLPPFAGYILSHIGKAEYADAVNLISKQLHISPDAITTFLSNMQKGGKRYIKFDDTRSIIFPEDLLVVSDEIDTREFYESANFDPFGDFIPHRPTIPFNLNLMVTTLCTTNCIYCYANRNLQPLLTADEICTFIKEAKKTGIVNISLTGGDIFAMPDWKMVLKTLIEYGYYSFLSTKTPLSRSELISLKSLGFHKFQFSLDSTDPSVLSEIINVEPTYLNKVVAMLEQCDELELEVHIRSVLTKLNGSLNSLIAIRDLLMQHKCIGEWDITPAFFSEFKQEYAKYEVSNDDLICLYQFTQDSASVVSFPIMLNKVNNDGYKLQRWSTCEEFVENNQRCVANTYSLSILASGECTVCEMLYNNPDYLLGNIQDIDIESIWNSTRALELYAPQQPESDSTPCAECTVFDECKRQLSKRVCYVDIAKVNGANSCHKPDPRCPKATPVDVLL